MSFRRTAFVNGRAGMVDSTWAIRRQRGAWAAFTRVDGPVVCRGGYETEDGPVLPSSLTGDSVLPIAWSDVEKAFPNSSDAAVSPSGEYLIVQRLDSLLLLRLRGGQPGETVMRVHLGYEQEFAMIRWSTPDETRRWIASLPAMQSPTIHVIPRNP